MKYPMWKPISKQAHGLIDYAYAVIVPLLPKMAGFDSNQPAKLLCRSLGAGALTYSVLTKACWGLFRILPFRSHLAVDISVSCVAIIAPWILGFADHKAARNAVLIAGGAGLAAALLTEPSEKQPAQNNYLFI